MRLVFTVLFIIYYILILRTGRSFLYPYLKNLLEKSAELYKLTTSTEDFTGFASKERNLRNEIEDLIIKTGIVFILLITLILIPEFIYIVTALKIKQAFIPSIIALIIFVSPFVSKSKIKKLKYDPKTIEGLSNSEVILNAINNKNYVRLELINNIFFLFYYLLMFILQIFIL